MSSEPHNGKMFPNFRAGPVFPNRGTSFSIGPEKNDGDHEPHPLMIVQPYHEKSKLHKV